MAERYCDDPKCVSCMCNRGIVPPGYALSLSNPVDDTGCIHAPTFSAPPDVDQHARSVVNDDSVGQAAVKGDRGQGVSSMPRCATCKHFVRSRHHPELTPPWYGKRCEVHSYNQSERLDTYGGYDHFRFEPRMDFGCVDHESGEPRDE